MTKIPIRSLFPPVVLLIAGCDSASEPSAFVQEATRRQAEQSQTVAETSQQVAEASRQFVEAEAASRREVIALQQDLRQDQAELGKQRDTLEAERQALDARRQAQVAQERRESALAAVLTNGGIIAACLAPLLLAAAALWGLWGDIGDQAAAELLITEIEPGPLRMGQERPASESEARIAHSCDGEGPPALPPAG